MILVFAVIVTIMFSASICIGFSNEFLKVFAKKKGINIEDVAFPVTWNNIIYGFRVISIITCVGMILMWIMYFIY